GQWLNKLAEHGNGIALVFARTDTAWFHDITKKCDAIFFKRGRIRFLTSEKESSNSAGAGSCFLAFGKTAVERLKRMNSEGMLIELNRTQGIQGRIYN